jgi:hypothetical protein
VEANWRVQSALLEQNSIMFTCTADNW